MITLTDHNTAIQAQTKGAGVACDKCGAEMRWTPAVNRPNGVYCPKCGFTGSKHAENDMTNGG